MTITPLASSSAGNAYIVDDGRSKLLIECGISFRRLQKLSGGLAGVCGCLMTHEHKDHSRAYLDVLRSGLPVFASGGTAAALKCDLIQTFDLCEPPGSGYVPLSIGTFDVLPFPTFHDAAEPVGYLVRSRADLDKLMFATDTVNLAYQFPGVNIVAVEANYSEEILARATKLPDKVRHRITNSHMEIGRCCDFIRRLDRSRLRDVYLLHLSDACSNEGLFQDLAERAAGPGVRVTICPK